MAVKINPELAKLRAAAKAPRDGYFSVLDELMGQLPQDRQFSAEEIRQRMRPGRMLMREDVQFPLKQEEVDYALNPVLNDPSKIFQLSSKVPAPLDAQRMTAGQWREYVRNHRPEFEASDPYDTLRDHGGSDYSSYSTQGPGRVDYFENVTDSPDFGKHPTHFSNDTLSFSRGSRHELPGGWVDRNGKNHASTLRLIDEIQNDRANDARERLIDALGDEGVAERFLTSDELDDYTNIHGMSRSERTPQMNDRLKELDGRLNEAGKARVGWRTPDDEQYLASLKSDNPHVWDHPGFDASGAMTRIADAPFKYPKDYGRLEIKNQLLAALDSDDDYLGITPASGPASWFPGTGAKNTTYDKLYPGELKKLAQQYGAPFETVGVPITSYDALSLPTLQGTDIVDYMSSQRELDPIVSIVGYRKLFDDLASARHIDEPTMNELEALDGEINAITNMLELGESSAEELLDATNTYADTLENAYREAMEKVRRDSGRTDTRPVPAMHLTPEIKEKIARIGLPLFTAAGASTALPELSQEDEMTDEPQAFAVGGRARPKQSLSSARRGQDEDIARIRRNGVRPDAAGYAARRRIRLGDAKQDDGLLGPLFPRFAGGGVVRRTAGALKTIRDAQQGRAGAEKGREMQWRDDMVEKAQSGAARRPAGGSRGRGESYGAWAEKRPTGRGNAPAKPAAKPKKGALATMREYLGFYQGGQVAIGEQYPEAVEGDFSPGDEFIGEDDRFEYYACGGPVKRGLGGKLKKAIKKVAKVAKSAAPMLGMVPGVGTVAGGLLGGVSGLIADGNLKGALSGALGGASGGVGNVLGRTAMQLGSGLLDASNVKGSSTGPRVAQPELNRIAEVPDMAAAQRQAVDRNASAPTQLSRVQPQQGRVQPGSNAGGLLAQIKQQQAAGRV